MAVEYGKFGEGQSPLEVEILNLQDTLEHLQVLGEEEVALGGAHIGVGNNVLSFVDKTTTGRKMLTHTINQIGWHPESNSRLHGQTPKADNVAIETGDNPKPKSQS